MILDDVKWPVFWWNSHETARYASCCFSSTLSAMGRLMPSLECTSWYISFAIWSASWREKVRGWGWSFTQNVSKKTAPSIPQTTLLYWWLNHVESNIAHLQISNGSPVWKLQQTLGRLLVPSHWVQVWPDDSFPPCDGGSSAIRAPRLEASSQRRSQWHLRAVFHIYFKKILELFLVSPMTLKCYISGRLGLTVLRRLNIKHQQNLD